MNITNVNNATAKTTINGSDHNGHVEAEVTKFIRYKEIIENSDAEIAVFGVLYAFVIISVIISLCKIFRGTSQNSVSQNFISYLWILLFNYLWITLSVFHQNAVISNDTIFLYLWFTLDFTKFITVVEMWLSFSQPPWYLEPSKRTGIEKFALCCITPFVLFYGIYSSITTEYASIAYLVAIIIIRMVRVIPIIGTLCSIISVEKFESAVEKFSFQINFLTMIGIFGVLTSFIYLISAAVLFLEYTYTHVVILNVPVVIVIMMEMGFLFAEGFVIGFGYVFKLINI